MRFRHQLPVASPLSATILLGATSDAVLGLDRRAYVTETIAREFNASAVLLTDSGTSALVLALQMAAGTAGTVAMPAYACVDLIAAARFADVRVSLYDVDPLTLTPDLDSLRRVAADGVRAIVVAHLYGYPADVPAIREIAAESGAVIIEDAAQHAGATLRGIRAGSMGDVSVLSFGRGKGTTAGNGGALLAFATPWTDTIAQRSAELEVASSGHTDLIGAAASWALGRPELYSIPASIPLLHLGETVYHEAHAPRRMTRAAGSILTRTLSRAADATAARRRKALALRAAAEQSRRVQSVTPLVGADPGYLRFPVRVRDDMPPAPELGITAAYPRALSNEPELQPILRDSSEPLHGAHDLARRLVTLPTHDMVTPNDIEAIAQWLRGSGSHSRPD